MNLDERGRRAAGAIRRAVGEPDAGAVDADPFERFERARRTRSRNRRIANGAVGAAVAAAAIASA
jgi:hypothetical protein